MSKFNAKMPSGTRTTTTYEGGLSYSKSIENEWANLLFSCLLNDGFYESSSEIQGRYIDLTRRMVEKRGASFVGRAAEFSRNVLGMRSISSLTAALLNGESFEGKRDFFKHYYHRPDDIAEVFAAIEMLEEKRSHALIRGTADYLSNLSDYQMTKYHMNGKTFNMYDLINLTHPFSSTVDGYVNHRLEAPDTWEQKVSGEKDPEKRKAELKRLVEQGKMGYLALLRNLRRIFNTIQPDREWVSKYLAPQLENEVKIKKSLVFPYQIYTAWKAVREGIPVSLEGTLEKALEISVDNLPKLEGKTLIVLDVSGSMDSRMSDHSEVSIKEACAVYVAGYYLSNPDNTDFIKFGAHAKQYLLNPSSGYLKLIRKIEDNDYMGYATILGRVMDLLDESDIVYDRILLFSDMQVMAEHDYFSTKPAAARMSGYLKDNKTHLYSFDLGNYHSQVVSDDSDITYVTSLNPVIFKMMDLIEGGDLIDVIEHYKPSRCLSMEEE